MTECASDVFRRRGVPVSPIVLERVLPEGVICPIVSHDAPAPSLPARTQSTTPRLMEGMSERAKLLVVFPCEDWTAARQVESALWGAGCGARLVRAIEESV